MSWGEVKKALNTNIAKPLDTLITEAKNTLNSSINTVSSNVNTIKTDVSSVLSKVNAMQGGIKKVQSGGVSSRNTSSTVTIQSVNTSKSFVVINGTGLANDSSYAGEFPSGYLNSSTSLVVAGGGTSGHESRCTYVRWQVVEFY